MWTNRRKIKRKLTLGEYAYSKAFIFTNKETQNRMAYLEKYLP